MTHSLARFSLLLLLPHVAACANEETSPDELASEAGDAASSGPSASGDGGVRTDGGAPLGRASGLPCEVQELLASHCVACHGMPPTGGAPRSLLSHADLTAFVSGGSTKVAQLALKLMKSNVMPPGTVRPSAAQIAAFAAWVEKGEPEAACGKAP